MIEAASLRYFREIAEQGSLRQAAARLFVAQSALSRHVVALEDELGASLFERHARGMTLTAAGHLLMLYANETRTRLDVLREQIAEFDGLGRGHVDIACVEGLLSGLMPQFVRNYLGRHSRIGLSVVALGSMAVAEAVAEHRVDLGIVFGQSPRSDLVELARMKQPLCVIVGAAHPLARKRNCRLVDALQYRLVLPDRSFGIRQLIDRVCAAGRLEPQTVVETNTLAFAWRLVLDTDYVTFLPMDSVRTEIAARRLVAVPLDDTLLRNTQVTLVASASRTRSIASNSVVDALKLEMATSGRKRGA